MLNMFKKKGEEKSSPRMPDVNTPKQTSYHSLDVPIPADFMSTTSLPSDSKPITVDQIDFSKTAVPEYSGRYAVVLDNVLSQSECDQLIRMAEASVSASEQGVKEGTGERDPWQPALVNIGAGWEVLQADYRNSDRIIWDQEEITGRLWKRIKAGAPEVAKELAEVEADLVVLGGKHWKEQKWVFKALNERMRFLKYGKGQFFRPHCDGAYEVPGLEPGKRTRTLFTLHLYLNDSVEAVKGETARDGEEKPELVGGSTPFLSNNEKRRVDVHPKAGRVLIFQHRGLLHSGDDVVEGTKYTVRSDILYDLVTTEKEE
ncbi:hypothetical protein MKZ38_001309 [Zalerion maritima]|uniref:Prolyl 4-hydroxylase alpha subunit domain-containing protein n=1 Tax=Zalerion maritima TaxID=339359 RepID=A0AAD5RR27_9PEZI|nr:hypothetical protein MKZ38_001309 [Zalerion maritima]